MYLAVRMIYSLDKFSTIYTRHPLDKFSTIYTRHPVDKYLFSRKKFWKAWPKWPYYLMKQNKRKLFYAKFIDNQSSMKL